MIHKVLDIFYNLPLLSLNNMPGHSLMASRDARTTSPGTLARNALPCLERISGAAMDPVTEMTVSSSDWLIFSVISDSFLTLKSQPDKHSLLLT